MYDHLEIQISPPLERFLTLRNPNLCERVVVWFGLCGSPQQQPQTEAEGPCALLLHPFRLSVGGGAAEKPDQTRYLPNQTKIYTNQTKPS